MHECDLERVEKTWEELGYRLRMLRNTVLVRTEPLPTESNGVILPDRAVSFYGELAHVQFVTATVLAAGPKAVLKPGDRIAFTRLFFARLLEMPDKTMVGWIANEENVLGYAEGERSYVPITANAPQAPPPPEGLVA
jgi:hypothetical protein